jgi:hypothetical protein
MLSRTCVKLNATTMRSVGHIARLQRLVDSDADDVPPLDMLIQLREDNVQLVAHVREAQDILNEMDRSPSGCERCHRWSTSRLDRVIQLPHRGLGVAR